MQWQRNLSLFLQRTYCDETPSFAIALYKEYRGLGIGTEMMKAMLAVLKNRGYKQDSLAVQKANYAVKMYCKVGFEIVGENDEEYISVSPQIFRLRIPMNGVLNVGR